MKIFSLIVMIVSISHLTAVSRSSVPIECPLRSFERHVDRPEGVLPSALSRQAASTNWSGYVSFPSHSPQNSVSRVSGSWVIPHLTSTTNPTYSSIWVGIDGFSDGSVEQIGTEQDWTGHSQSNYAWFEMYPQGAYEIVGFPVNVGDVIYASVQYVNAGTFQLIIENLTKNVYFVVPSSYTHAPSAQRSSAEWIVEAPYNRAVLPLANFGQITFTQCQATIGGFSNSLTNSHWLSEGIEMETTKGAIKALPSAPYNAGQNFMVSWESQ